MAFPAGAEKDFFAVGIPFNHLVIVSHPLRDIENVRVKGELTRFPALSWHNIDMGASLVLAGKGNVFAIRREPGEYLLTGMRGKLPGHTALTGDQPEIACIGEDNFALVDVRISHQPAFLSLSQAEADDDEQKCG